MDAYRGRVQAFVDQVLDYTPRSLTAEASALLVSDARLPRDGM